MTVYCELHAEQKVSRGEKDSENLVLKDGFTPEQTNMIWKLENIHHQVRS